MREGRLTDGSYRILIVEDEEAARYGMRRALASFGYDVGEAGSVEAARSEIASKVPDVILLDVNLPGESGLDLLQELSQREQGEEDRSLIILVTAHGSERMAADAIKSGAYDYLPKPFEVDDLRLVVKNALETVRLRRENRSLKDRIELETTGSGTLIGSSEAMKRVRAMIEKVADTDATILVRGESGTGKELVARELHERSSSRHRNAFVAINCAALPSELIESELFGHEKGAFTGASARRQGKFEQAEGGTLFLDEIGDMSANVQAKLLRALEERRIERLGGGESIPVDVRVVSATHRDLEQDIGQGKFRADLFYRLQVVTIEIAPLRERSEDIPELAERFAIHAAHRHNLAPRAIAPSAMRRLIGYRWPGNVRELRNTIERAVILAEGAELTEADLAGEIFETGQEDTVPERDVPLPNEEGDLLRVPYTSDFREDRREFERRYISRCLEDSGGNVTRAASLLGMHRQSLQHKLRELGLARRYVSVGGEEET